MPTLYITGTPIGNLEDITMRALRVLAEVDLVAAEDTRVTGRLLKHFQINTPMYSFHDYSSADKMARLLNRLESQDVALVTDAGMPGVSDPGYKLVSSALAAGVAVVVIPGPTAAVTALVSSGLPSDRFLFLGFLARSSKARQAELNEVAHFPGSIILYESPHRLVACLGDVVKALGDRPVAVGRELTKMHEEVWRGAATAAIVEFSGRDRIRGEITLVIGGKVGGNERWNEDQVRQAVREQIEAGQSRKDASASVATLAQWRKRDVYALSLEES